MKTTITSALLLLTGSLAAFAQFTIKSSVQDGSGTVSSGGGYTNISACGQSGGIACALAGPLPLSAGSIVNQAGFLNTFCLRPNLLSVRGLPVEIDPDNDADGLSDLTEITGSRFNPATATDPNNPDSDGDGASDAAEAIAGTNPNDADAVLLITSIAKAGGQGHVAWRARGNNECNYRVLTATEVSGPFTNVIYSGTVGGGIAPWYVVTNSIADAFTDPTLFYRVEVP